MPEMKFELKFLRALSLSTLFLHNWQYRRTTVPFSSSYFSHWPFWSSSLIHFLTVWRAIMHAHQNTACTVHMVALVWSLFVRTLLIGHFGEDPVLIANQSTASILQQLRTGIDDVTSISVNTRSIAQGGSQTDTERCYFGLFEATNGSKMMCSSFCDIKRHSCRR